MKLQKIVKRLQGLHPKEIDLSLDRTKDLCQKLGNPQDKINCISVVGTNGKYSTIQALYSILKEANYKCNIYTSPHIKNINERFVFNNKPLTDDKLASLLGEIEEINNNSQITFFEILTVAYFHYAKKYPKNINLIESGLFHRFDATNILKKNIASIVTAIGLDHLDWLPKEEQTVKKIIFEKTSTLLHSKIIVARQNSDEINNHIENTLKDNRSKKLIFNKNYSFTLKENNFFYYEDEFGGLKLPQPNLLGAFQLENISSAIATARQLKDYKITDEHIKNSITKIESIARIQEIKSGKLKGDRKTFYEKEMEKQEQNKKVAIANERGAGAAANAGTQRGGGAGDSSTSHMGGISQSQADAVGKANKDAGMGGWGLKDGGRAGYFFGGRVNYKNGGLASIL